MNANELLIWLRVKKRQEAAQRMALADHASEPIIERDFEPEQVYGTADDFKKHQQYGGSREDY